jgi:hypothetical protein
MVEAPTPLTAQCTVAGLISLSKGIVEFHATFTRRADSRTPFPRSLFSCF